MKNQFDMTDLSFSIQFTTTILISFGFWALYSVLIWTQILVLNGTLVFILMNLFLISFMIYNHNLKKTVSFLYFYSHKIRKGSFSSFLVLISFNYLLIQFFLKTFAFRDNWSYADILFAKWIIAGHHYPKKEDLLIFTSFPSYWGKLGTRLYTPLTPIFLAILSIISGLDPVYFINYFPSYIIAGIFELILYFRICGCVEKDQRKFDSKFSEILVLLTLSYVFNIGSLIMKTNFSSFIPSLLLNMLLLLAFEFFISIIKVHKNNVELAIKELALISVDIVIILILSYLSYPFDFPIRVGIIISAIIAIFLFKYSHNSYPKVSKREIIIASILFFFLACVSLFLAIKTNASRYYLSIILTNLKTGNLGVLQYFSFNNQVTSYKKSYFKIGLIESLVLIFYVLFLLFLIRIQSPKIYFRKFFRAPAFVFILSLFFVFMPLIFILSFSDYFISLRASFLIILVIKLFISYILPSIKKKRKLFKKMSLFFVLIILLCNVLYVTPLSIEQTQVFQKEEVFFANQIEPFVEKNTTILSDMKFGSLLLTMGYVSVLYYPSIESDVVSLRGLYYSPTLNSVSAIIINLVKNYDLKWILLPKRVFTDSIVIRNEIKQPANMTLIEILHEIPWMKYIYNSHGYIFVISNFSQLGVEK